jgi:hypothetical protein
MRGAKRKTLGLAACSFTNKHGARPRVSLKTVARRKAANFAAGVDVDKPDPAVPSREDENGGSTEPVSNRSSGRSSGSGPSPDHLPSPERGPVVYRSGSTTSITAARPRRNGSDCSVTGFPFAAVCMKTTAGNTAARVTASIAVGESASIGLDAHYLVLRFLEPPMGMRGGQHNNVNDARHMLWRSTARSVKNRPACGPKERLSLQQRLQRVVTCKQPCFPFGQGAAWSAVCRAMVRLRGWWKVGARAGRFRTVRLVVQQQNQGKAAVLGRGRLPYLNNVAES